MSLMFINYMFPNKHTEICDVCHMFYNRFIKTEQVFIG